MNPASAFGLVTNLDQQFSRLETVWSPKVIAETEDYKVIILLAEGEFIWHTHEDEDKLFMVTDGELFIDFRNGERVSIKQGEFFIVPKGEESRPWSEVRTRLLLIAPIIAGKGQ
ncbi:cupin domain-containing protein [Pluralibacter gergoviae]|uniref:cupin domain-containing protein n=1 Tax=Pluralibacter gergoviae TaxID=61647 RepID=UPI0006507F55|nr:cupin domain-containing protein [Pluralibacter gergoviae]KMK10110.1 cupin [Pluralibacter gergoviae]